MGEKITLYTPCTGFPDLEAKIAYGLARVGIEAFKSNNVKLTPESGYYKIEINGNWATFEKAFVFISHRLLSSSFIPSNTPGITGRTADKLTIKEGESVSLDLYKNFPRITFGNRKSEIICRHQWKGVKISNVIGLTSSTSYHHERDFINVQIYRDKRRGIDKIQRPTDPIKICKTCALLSLLGTWYATFMFSVKGRQIFAVPLPKKEIWGITLTKIFSLHHIMRKEWINKDIPQRAVPLILLIKIPSSAEILEGFDLFVTVLSRQQGYHVDGLSILPLEPFLDYVKYSSYNVASIDTMLNKNAFNSLLSLSNLLFSKSLTGITKFAREYSKETSTNNFVNLLYPETVYYLLREIGMIKKEIIENGAIGSVARTLRYFVREGKYQYADNIRNARKDSKEFENTIVKMLREAELRRVQEEKKEQKERYKFVNIPSEKEIKELFQLANKDFDEVKTALVILAFSFPTKKEEIDEIRGEVKNA